MTKNLTLTAAVLGLSVSLGSAIGGYFVYKGIARAKDERYVTVKGLVERTEKADRGIFSLDFQIVGDDMKGLYQQALQVTDVIKTFLLKAGVEASQVVVGAPRLEDMRRFSSAPPERYSMNVRISVESLNVDLLADLPSQVGSGLPDALFALGASITSMGNQFFLDRFNHLRPQLIADATINALKVAKGFAQTTGTQTLGIRRANQGTITITDPNASPTETYHTGESSLMKKIRVVSTIDFFLK